MNRSTGKLKIGIVLDDSLDRNDGVQQYVRLLGGWLARQGHTVHYLVGETLSSDPSIHSLSRNVRVRFNGNYLSVPLPVKSKSIKLMLDQESFDILHIQMPYNPFLAGKIIRYAPNQTTIVGTFHIMPLGKLQRYGSHLLKTVQASTLKKFSMIFSVSPASQAFAQSAFGLNSSVIPNMVDIQKWKTLTPNIPGRIVFLGRLVKRKGCSELLAALMHLQPAQLQSIEVIIAGDGPQRQTLEAFAAANKLNNVRFIGFVSEQDKKPLLASAELAIFPSLGGESFGIVLIEAMAAGAGVVIGGNNPGYAGVLGVESKALINPRDPSSFAMAISTFLNDKQLREHVHAEQQAKVLQFDVQTVGPMIVKKYREALNLASVKQKAI